MIKSSNQADARRRAQRQYDNAKKSGASKKTQDTLRAELDAAKARESGAKRSSGGAISRIFGG